ncbi:hypothetical protein G3I60_26040 [Streptomyces sp. SID13666]|uniref:methyltransferase n=1 Tax=unclassified Streptomyces TaxID=2593676 RepID=UPI0013BF83EE|nr:MULTISPECIES: methyltransferase [unclassified Streptomyces]NEA57520.1 hypothetical protein [Streptomyces sp. SID13666]NEA70976.1 hypothetical protein [Streptomyces sp. SID13588]
MSSQISGQPATAAEYLPLSFGFALHQIGAAVSSLGVLDALADGPRTAAQLVEVTDAHAGSLRRLLYAATKAKLLTVDSEGYHLAPLSAFFGPLSDYHAAPEIWAAWGAFEESIRTGVDAFQIANGAPLFDYIKTNPKLAATFHAAMSAGSDAQVPAIVEHFDFSRFKTIVDCGGGKGTHLTAILAANPHLQGTVFDTANGVVEAAAVIEAAGVGDRCEVVVGSFFDSVPEGADLYVLKNILHDWNDEESVQILSNIRKAMAPGGRVVVLSSVLSEGEDEDPGDALGGAISDIEMLVMTTGLERSQSEYAQLFTDAGLKLSTATALPCPWLYYALEATAS